MDKLLGGKIPNYKNNSLFMTNMENINVIFKGEYIIKTLAPLKTILLNDDFIVEETTLYRNIIDDIPFDNKFTNLTPTDITDKIQVYLSLEIFDYVEIEDYVNYIFTNIIKNTQSRQTFLKTLKKFPFVISKEKDRDTYRYIGLSAKPNLFNRYTFIYKFIELLKILYNEKYRGFDLKYIYNDPTLSEKIFTKKQTPDVDVPLSTKPKKSLTKKQTPNPSLQSSSYVDKQKQLLVDLEKDIMTLFEDSNHKFTPADATHFTNETTWQNRFKSLDGEKKNSNDVLMQRYVNFHDMMSMLSTYTDDIKNNLDEEDYHKNPTNAYSKYIDKIYKTKIETQEDIQSYNTYLLREIKDILFYRTNIIDVLDVEDEKYPYTTTHIRPSIRLFMLYFSERLNKKQLALNDRGGNILPISFKHSLKSVGFNLNDRAHMYKMYPYWTTYNYNYKDIRFPGCAETATIEAIKSLCYNINTQRFDSSLLPNTTIPEIKEFIDKYEPNDYGGAPTYNVKLMEHLLDIFENRPEINYKKQTANNINYEFYSIDFFSNLTKFLGVNPTNIKRNEFITNLNITKNNMIVAFVNGWELNIHIKSSHVDTSFKNTSNESSKIYDEIIEKILISRIMNGVFIARNKYDLRNLYTVVLKNSDTFKNIEKIDISHVKDMSYLFSGFNMLKSLDFTFNKADIYNITNWDVRHVTNMEGIFSGCRSFDISLNHWKVDNVINMMYMFFGCSVYDQPLDLWKVHNVTNMSYMFCNCMRFNQPLQEWDVSKVTNMEYMFYNCVQFNQPLNPYTKKINTISRIVLKKQNTTKWNVSNVTNMEYMFGLCTNFNQPLNNWNVKNVVNMGSMFYNSGFNQPLNKWDVRNVLNMKSMFDDCVNFKQPIEWTLNDALIYDPSKYEEMFYSEYPYYNRGVGILVKKGPDAYLNYIAKQEEKSKSLYNRIFTRKRSVGKGGARSRTKKYTNKLAHGLSASFL